MAHRATIGDDRHGPVAEASTREQCIALYPGSNPGRASSLRHLPRQAAAAQLRLGKPAATKCLPRHSSKSDGGLYQIAG